MNDGDSTWERSPLVEPPTPISANPWSDPKPSSKPGALSTSNNNTLLLSVNTPTRGRSTSIATNSGTSLAATTTAERTNTGEQTFHNNLRPRARLRRLRSDTEDAADGQKDESTTSGPATPYLSSEMQGASFSNGSTASLGAARGLEGGKNAQGIRPLNSRSVTPSTSAYKRRKSPTEPLSELPSPLPPDFDWDEDDKTREGKARKQGKSSLRTTLPSPFSFTLSSGFGSKLWGDVETLWNEALSPTPKTATAHGGHAYLDVWGRPVASPSFEEPESSRGRDRSVVGDHRKVTGRTRGPLIEREDVSTSTTPALSRKTTDTFKERSRSRNLVSGEGISILEESLATTKVKDEIQAEVFEHMVLPTDSLAGVALKYGVTVAQLRKANKMWASDTIHLRKVLYIPVGTSSKNIQTRELIDLTNNMSQTSLSSSTISASQSNITSRSRKPGSSFSSPSKTSYVESSPSTYNATLSESTSTSSLTPSKSISSTPSTKRIPISELSYFPPPSAPSTTIFTSNPHPSTISSGIARKWELQNGALVGSFNPSLSVDGQPSSRANSPSRNGLAASIFYAFPSLNDTTSRASFDTVRSVGSIPGSGNVSGEEDMELDEIKLRYGNIAGTGSMPSRGIKKRVKPKSRAIGDEGGTSLKESGARGKVITQQLAPRSMELPNLQLSRREGSYGEGWVDPEF